MSAKITDCDLSAIFDIDVVGSFEAPIGLMCDKCHGRGTFIGYNGRVVGKCFTCDGKGVSRGAAVDLKPGDCVKCAGTGEWRLGRPCFACGGTGKDQIAPDVDVSAIATAFASAREKGIKSPKLRLDDFVFSRAPDTGKNAGAIYVKQSGEYLGKIAGGAFHSTMTCDAPTKERVIAAASSPHESAKAYGMKTGQCSCCGRELTNGASIELGIGPICRDKFGWG